MFNHSQNQAIRLKKGPALVLAGPGSGKTLVITHRIKKLIESGVDPSSILVVTFTKAAALEMEKRFYKLINENREKVYPVTFGTFHSVYYSILRSSKSNYHGEIITDKQKSEYIKEVIIKEKLKIDNLRDFFTSAGNDISRVKSNMISLNEFVPESMNREDFSRFYRKYVSTLKMENKLDFDDILIDCLSLLKNNSQVRKIWQEKYQYILVDEFQDINSVQYEVAKVLSYPENNIFVVGDDDQSIYGFRGARPEMMKRFLEDYKETKKIVLNINYRSTPKIVEKSQRLICHNENRFEKDVKSHKRQYDSDKLDIRKFKTKGNQLTYTAEKIKEYIGKGKKEKDIAILVRNNNQIGDIVKELKNNGINVKSNIKSKSIYESMVGKDIVSYITAALNINKYLISDNRELVYIMNKPMRFISRKVIVMKDMSFAKMKDFYNHSMEVKNNIDKLEFDLEMISKLNPSAAFNYIKNGIGYEEYLRNYSKNNGLKINDLTKQLDEVGNHMSGFDTLEEWLNSMEQVEKSKNQEGINILTMHSSKGLEFDTVFILDANMGIIPTSKAVRKRDYEEERRLFYVAMTRAKNNLNIYGVMENLGCEVNISMFVYEALE